MATARFLMFQEKRKRENALALIITWVINNYSPQAQRILWNNPLDIIPQYSLRLRRIIVKSFLKAMMAIKRSNLTALARNQQDFKKGWHTKLMTDIALNTRQAGNVARILQWRPCHLLWLINSVNLASAASIFR